MRYYIVPLEIPIKLRQALATGIGLSPLDDIACATHCHKYGVKYAPFVSALEVCWAAMATAGMLGAPILCDSRGRLCYDVPDAPAEPWQDDEWLAALVG